MHEVNFRVYYEDTDSGGVVYHSNYLKFTERARTELMRSIGIEQREFAEKAGIIFMVSKMEIKFSKPAKLDDILTIRTKVIKINNVSLDLFQEIMLSENSICEMSVKIACIKNETNKFKPTKIPDLIKQKLEKYA